MNVGMGVRERSTDPNWLWSDLEAGFVMFLHGGPFKDSHRNSFPSALI